MDPGRSRKNFLDFSQSKLGKPVKRRSFFAQERPHHVNECRAPTQNMTPKVPFPGLELATISDPLFSTAPRPNAPEPFSRSGKWGFRPRRIDCRAVRPNPSSGCGDIPKFSPKIHEMPTFPKLQNLLGLVVGRALHLRLGVPHLGDRWRIERGSRWYLATLRQPRGCRAIPLFVIRVPKYRHF